MHCVNALTGTPSRQAEQSRANAYAAMRRGESVQLSKDAINQLDQSSLTQRQDLRQEYPNQDIADASDDMSPDDDEDDGLEVYYPPSDSRHSTAATNGKRSSKMGKGKKRTSGTTAIEVQCVAAAVGHDCALTAYIICSCDNHPMGVCYLCLS